MAPLHQHQNNAMSNEQNDKQSTESGGAVGKPAVRRRASRSQVREQRANEVCRELRWQIANNQWDGNELAKKVAKWLEVAKRDKYDKLRLVNPSVPT